MLFYQLRWWFYWSHSLSARLQCSTTNFDKLRKKTHQDRTIFHQIKVLGADDCGDFKCHSRDAMACSFPAARAHNQPIRIVAPKEQEVQACPKPQWPEWYSIDDDSSQITHEKWVVDKPERTWLPSTVILSLSPVFNFRSNSFQCVSTSDILALFLLI